MGGRKPFDKESREQISFEELVGLIGEKCDYKFAVIDYEVDDDLKDIAKKEGIDLEGYKHVIETSGTAHSFLIPFIIKNRDSVIISPSSTRRHKNKVFIYEKKIGNQYVYVEEIRRGRNKSLAFKSLRKRKASN